jgi:glycosyltransferase involved in cell wall biosynthesis
MSERRCLVVSAVNLTEGGPLTVLRAFVDAACEVLPSEWEIVVFAHDESLLSADRPKIIRLPRTKRSYVRRLWVEWFEFRRHAVRLAPDLWISLQDISPRVGKVPQVVYCQNPSPFYKMRPRDAIFEPTLLMFWLAYKWLYRINLARNRAVIVQQSWLREEFRRWVGHATTIIVAHPYTSVKIETRARRALRIKGAAKFLYPALPRAFKNVELLCRAAEELEGEGHWQSEIALTIDGTENRYARWLKRRFGRLRTVRFAGRQSDVQMRAMYGEADCLLFPSRLETWGLPISEAKQYDLPMFIADLPYAKETVGTYPHVEFVDIEDHRALARKLRLFQDEEFEFRPAVFATPESPFAPDWKSLILDLRALVS